MYDRRHKACRWACQSPGNKAASPELRACDVLCLPPFLLGAEGGTLGAGSPQPHSQGGSEPRLSLPLAFCPLRTWRPMPVVSMERAKQVTRTAWENLQIPHQQGPLTPGCLRRGSLWQFSPGGVSRGPGLDISILQGHTEADQMNLLLLRTEKGQVGAAVVGDHQRGRG